MASLLSRPWMEDSASPWCLLCRTAFTFTTRRHHCRECGDLVCSACSSRSLVLEKADDRTPQRVCDNCFARLDTDVFVEIQISNWELQSLSAGELHEKGLAAGALAQQRI